MSACLSVEGLSCNEIPEGVQEIINKLLENSGIGDVFRECKFLPPASICSLCEDRVFINPWNGNSVQFRICFMGEERHFFLVSKGTVSRAEQNRIYLALQSAADFVFEENPREKKAAAQVVGAKKSVFVPPQNMIPQNPEKESAGKENVAIPLLATNAREAPRERSPKESLPDICRKILAAIEANDMSPDNVSRKSISDIIGSFFAPSSPRVLKGLLGPTISLLRGRNILTPLYGQSQTSLKSGYRLPIGYSVNVSGLKMCADGKNEVASPKKETITAPRRRASKKTATAPVSKKNGTHVLRSEEDLVWVTNELHLIEQTIVEREQELRCLREKKDALMEVQSSLYRAVEGFKKFTV